MQEELDSWIKELGISKEEDEDISTNSNIDFENIPELMTEEMPDYVIEQLAHPESSIEFVSAEELNYVNVESINCKDDAAEAEYDLSINKKRSINNYYVVSISFKLDGVDVILKKLEELSNSLNIDDFNKLYTSQFIKDYVNAGKFLPGTDYEVSVEFEQIPYEEYSILEKYL